MHHPGPRRVGEGRRGKVVAIPDFESVKRATAERVPDEPVESRGEGHPGRPRQPAAFSASSQIPIDQARTRDVPGLVLAEVDYFLRDERQGMPCIVHESHRWLLLARADVEITRAETARPIGTEEEARTVGRQRRVVFT